MAPSERQWWCDVAEGPRLGGSPTIWAAVTGYEGSSGSICGNRRPHPAAEPDGALLDPGAPAYVHLGFADSVGQNRDQYASNERRRPNADAVPT
jgi:hypothetical protein